MSLGGLMSDIEFNLRDIKNRKKLKSNMSKYRVQHKFYENWIRIDLVTILCENLL